MRALSALSLLVMLSTGCVTQSVVGQQLGAMRDEMPAVDTIGDLEIAEVALRGNLGQYESYHRALPDDPDGLYILTRSWTEMGYSFIEADFERHYEQGDRAQAAYHLLRARAAYDRAIFFGKRLLEVRRAGFGMALSDLGGLPAWLAQNFDDEKLASELFWVASAYLNRVRVGDRDSKDAEARTLTGLYSQIGVALMGRAMRLDETVLFGFGHALLGAHFARFDEQHPEHAQAAFEKAVALGQGQFALTPVLRAATSHCMSGDRDAFDRDLAAAIAAKSRVPELALWNAVAKRRAQRYLLAGGPLRHCQLLPRPALPGESKPSASAQSSSLGTTRENSADTIRPLRAHRR
jgi:hypothetical protein